MKTITYSIAPQVFEQFPEYVRGVLLVNGVKNSASPAELVNLMRAEESALRARLTTETLLSDARVSAWREAFRSLGIKPSEFRPSLEAMVRRVLNGNELPRINALVDIGNIISLRHLISSGGHALDDIRADIALRPATGEEKFVPFGSQEMEHPQIGELIFAEGDVVMTRRWVWRQSNHSLTELRTRVIEFNLDGLPPVGQAALEKISVELSALVSQYCGGKFHYQTLSRTQPEIRLNLEE